MSGCTAGWCCGKTCYRNNGERRSTDVTPCDFCESNRRFPNEFGVAFYQGATLWRILVYDLEDSKEDVPTELSPKTLLITPNVFESKREGLRWLSYWLLYRKGWDPSWGDAPNWPPVKTPPED